MAPVAILRAIISVPPFPLPFEALKYRLPDNPLALVVFGVVAVWHEEKRKKQAKKIAARDVEGIE